MKIYICSWQIAVWGYSNWLLRLIMAFSFVYFTPSWWLRNCELSRVLAYIIQIYNNNLLYIADSKKKVSKDTRRMKLKIKKKKQQIILPPSTFLTNTRLLFVSGKKPLPQYTLYTYIYVYKHATSKTRATKRACRASGKSLVLRPSYFFKTLAAHKTRVENDTFSRS